MPFSFCDLRGLCFVVLAFLYSSTIVSSFFSKISAFKCSLLLILLVIQYVYVKSGPNHMSDKLC